MDVDYYTKYLKYKQKYIDLKMMIGGFLPNDFFDKGAINKKYHKTRWIQISNIKNCISSLYKHLTDYNKNKKLSNTLLYHIYRDLYTINISIDFFIKYKDETIDKLIKELNNKLVKYFIVLLV